MSMPPLDEPVPARVSELAGGRPLTPVWRNLLGGTTFLAGPRPADAPSGVGSPRWPGGAAPEGSSAGKVPSIYIKYGPLNSESTMAAEAEKLRWLRPRLAGTGLITPRVLEQGVDATHEWLVTEALPYSSVVSDAWRTHPEVAVPAAARALRTLHDTVDPDTCPFTWSAADRIHTAGASGVEVPGHLTRGPEVVHRVVAHGDACLPNTLLDARGEPAALVDLALLGVADVWADLAAALWSVDFNFGPGWQGTYLDAYGIGLDRERLDFHLEFRRYA